MIPRTAVGKVLNVFPDADDKFVKSLLRRNRNNPEIVLEKMIEDGYDKRLDSINPVERDFASTSWEVTEEYAANALEVLQNDFPYVRQDGLRKLFVKYNSHYYPTFHAIETEVGVKAVEIEKSLSDEQVEKMEVGLKKLNLKRKLKMKWVFHFAIIILHC